MKKLRNGQLKKKLWVVFSKYIRKRDKNTCFTCGRTGTGSGMHSGHMFPKSVSGLSLYFDPRAVFAQCYHCNINLGGNGAVYATKFIEKFGQELFDELYDLKFNGYRKITDQEYIDLIEEYTNKLENE